jgi:hypothetical protein
MSPEELAEIARQRSAFMPSPQLLHKLVEMGFSLGKVPDSALVMMHSRHFLSVGVTKRRRWSDRGVSLTRRPGWVMIAPVLR